MDARLAEAAGGRASDAYVEPLLRRVGFAPQDAGSPYGWARTWVRASTHGEPHFVRLTMSLDPRDVPYFIGASLGEGDPRSWLVTELHGLPLWRLVADRTGTKGPDYGIDDHADVDDVIRRIAADLETHAADFLGGDLAPYRRLLGPVPRHLRLSVGAAVAKAIIGRALLELVWHLIRRLRGRR